MNPDDMDDEELQRDVATLLAAMNAVIQALQIKNKNGSVNRIEKFSLILFERAVLIIESLNKKVGAVPIDFDDDYEEPHYEKI